MIKCLQISYLRFAGFVIFFFFFEFYNFTKILGQNIEISNKTHILFLCYCGCVYPLHLFVWQHSISFGKILKRNGIFRHPNVIARKDMAEITGHTLWYINIIKQINKNTKLQTCCVYEYFSGVYSTYRIWFSKSPNIIQQIMTKKNGEVCAKICKYTIYSKHWSQSRTLEDLRKRQILQVLPDKEKRTRISEQYLFSWF